jgi:hypothetical protein
MSGSHWSSAFQSGRLAARCRNARANLRAMRHATEQQRNFLKLAGLTPFGRANGWPHCRHRLRSHAVMVRASMPVPARPRARLLATSPIARPTAARTPRGATGARPPSAIALRPAAAVPWRRPLICDRLVQSACGRQAAATRRGYWIAPSSSLVCATWSSPCGRITKTAKTLPYGWI